MYKIRKEIFLVPFSIISFVVLISLIFPKEFRIYLEEFYEYIGSIFGWLFSSISLSLVFLCGIVYFSPLGNKKVGGEDAKPFLDKWSWFTITLCTTIAAGILFWSVAEPIYHYVIPPSFLEIKAESYRALTFSMSTMYLHWGLTPYAIYCIPSIVFAYTHYNMKNEYSFNSCYIPLVGKERLKSLSNIIDILCLFITGIGLAASLGIGILSISSGISQLFNIEITSYLWIFVGTLIVLSFVLASISGVTKGMRFLSNLNTKIFIGIMLFILLFGPTRFILNLTFESLGEYLNNFIIKNLQLGNISSKWATSWTIQYLASWLSWAPMIALFLGRIAYGYTYKEFVLVNMFFPSIFSMTWVSILGGASLYFHKVQNNMMEIIEKLGIESVLYTIFRFLPLSSILLPILIITIFLSFVTAAESTTTAMARLCVVTKNEVEAEAPNSIKIIWGVLIGSVSILMINLKGIDGVRILSIVSGIPALLLVFLTSVSLVKIIKNIKKGGVYEE